MSENQPIEPTVGVPGESASEEVSEETTGRRSSEPFDSNLGNGHEFDLSARPEPRPDPRPEERERTQLQAIRAFRRATDAASIEELERRMNRRSESPARRVQPHARPEPRPLEERERLLARVFRQWRRAINTFDQESRAEFTARLEAFELRMTRNSESRRVPPPARPEPRPEQHPHPRAARILETIELMRAENEEYDRLRAEQQDLDAADEAARARYRARLGVYEWSFPGRTYSDPRPLAERERRIRELRQADLTSPAAPTSLPCRICFVEAPNRRAAFTACGHTACLACAEQLTLDADRVRKDVHCPFCRKKTGFLALFEE